LPPSYKTLPPSGSMRSGRLLPLPTLAHRTSATGSGSSGIRVPTPTKIDASTSATHKRSTKGRHALGLAHLANAGVLEDEDPVQSHIDLQPTLLASSRSASGSRSWPTPRASGKHATGGGELSTYHRTAAQKERGHGLYLQVEVCEVEAASGRKRGRLNPEWVEWLMGYPRNWTALAPSETPSSPRS
jgi:hypothetical protein